MPEITAAAMMYRFSDAIWRHAGGPAASSDWV
jgi:hypothetical protein